MKHMRITTAHQSITFSRRMMLLGGLLLGAGYAALSFATSFPQVLAIYGLILATSVIAVTGVGSHCVPLAAIVE